MTSAGGHPAAGPLIAEVGLPSGDFHDLSDDEFGSAPLFDFSTSPDTLQGLEAAIGSNHQKSCLNPQDLTSAGPFPDSPNGSYHDSSSESASSSKRTRSTDSAKTPPTTRESTMDTSPDMKVEWGDARFPEFAEDDHPFTFGREADIPAIDGLFPFGEQDDSFMDHSFDFESASSSPDTQPATSHTSMASPSMPTIKNSSPQKSTGKNSHKTKNKTGKHKKQNSQFSTSSHGAKIPSSREVSPMSALVTSHHSSSPAATFFNSPSSSLGTRINGSTIWSNKVDIASASASDTLPTPAQFAKSLTQSVPMSMSIPQQSSTCNGVANPSAQIFTSGYELRILPTPLKSRVETQIPIKMTLSPLPPGVTKLHLPTHTISKPKLLTRPTPGRSPDTLELHVGLVCTSAMESGDLRKKALERAASVPQGYLPDLDDEANAPQNGGDVRICAGCITRERKRAARKKIKKPEEEKVWSLDEERRVIVFNTQEVKEWQPLSGVLDANGRPDPVVPSRAMQIDAPMRIACYCRHHSEKMGFNVIFTIKDYQDRVIAQAMSNPIMITDDHKTHPMTQVSNPQVSEAVTTTTIPVPLQQPMDTGNIIMLQGSQNGAFQAPQQNGEGNVNRGGQSPFQGSSASGKTTPTLNASTPTGRTLSRPSSPNQGGPAKKRKSSSSGRVPNGLTMTRLDTSPAPGSQTTSSSQVSNAPSPFSPHASPFQASEQLFGVLNGQQSFTNGPPTPGSTDQVPLFSNPNRSASMDNLAMTQLYSAPASSHPSRAPSPNGLRNSVANNLQNQFSQNLTANLYTLPINVNQTRPPPVIHKIIPNEGPTIGGIEVTVLGASFFQGLEVWFGECKATTTTYWGDSSLVCLLPPSPVAGAVAVTFKHQGVVGPPGFGMGKQPSVFKYIDDNEDKLIRTALSVLGHKMSGQMVDVSDLARRILSDGNSSWSAGGGGGGGAGGGGSNGNGSVGPSSGGTMFNHSATTHHEHLESQLLKCLDLIDLDDSTHKTRLDLKRPTGHTMLHLACSLGYHRFVAALLARGANPDARDKGGFTPLHMAAIHNHPEIVRRLMLVGADPTIRSLSSLTPADLAQSRAVLRAIRQSERHVRSRSGGSFHSRVSSAASLRSLWEPMTRANTHEEPIHSDELSVESPEYTSGDFEDEDPDEDHYLIMRRVNTTEEDEQSDETSDEDSSRPADDAPGSPTTAMAAALRDQVQQQLQQFQQTMGWHLQNLAHLPQMPALPGMAMLPHYQEYLQRVQQLMPGMSAARPGAAGSSGSSGDQHTKMDTRWWDISSYMNNSGSALPPAYEDIFPQKDLDRKEESVVRAAAETEADAKCATLYDQPTTTTTRTTKVMTQLAESEPPEVLKIGRKNAITKEQQEQFLRAREAKLKSLGSDRNLFFIWIPLLLVMVCAMLYSYFPSLFPFIWTSVRALVQAGHNRVFRPTPSVHGRVMEV
ncbi:hypothetical protein E4U55_007373 [Claviceps digitariae]|nr:hypothetical protein E4U55_007373 [Claviceps digitariae]